MKRHNQTRVLMLVMVIIALIPGGARAAESWQAPPEAARVKNPVPRTQESIDRGKLLYLQYCMSCHGISGKGDGPEAAGLDPKPGDFTDATKMNAQTDGELFWKLTNGKGKMKSYAEISPTPTDQEKWDLVNFLRTFVESGKSTGAGMGNPPVPREARALLTAYLNVAVALNAGNLTSATKNAEVLGALAGKDLLAGLSEDSRGKAGKLVKDLAPAAKRLQAAADLAAARQAFAGVSRTVNAWQALSQFRYGKALTVYKHPRALAGQEAIWLQENGPALNPYGVRDPRRAAVLRKIPAGRAANRPTAP